MRKPAGMRIGVAAAATSSSNSLSAGVFARAMVVFAGPSRCFRPRPTWRRVGVPVRAEVGRFRRARSARRAWPPVPHPRLGRETSSPLSRGFLLEWQVGGATAAPMEVIRERSVRGHRHARRGGIAALRPSGGLRLAAVPRGRYRVSVWSPRLADDPGLLRREIDIDSAGTTAVEFKLGKSLRASPEPRPHPQGWDAY